MSPGLDGLGEPVVNSRRHEGYEPRFDIDYEFGKQGELFVQNIIAALGTDRIEVKHDARYEQTGNIYVEFRCLRKGEWTQSGIATTGAEFWAFVLHEGSSCVFVSTDALKLAVRRLWSDKRKHAACDKGDHPTKGVLVPIAWLLQHGTRMDGAA